MSAHAELIEHNLHLPPARSTRLAFAPVLLSAAPSAERSPGPKGTTSTSPKRRLASPPNSSAELDEVITRISELSETGSLSSLIKVGRLLFDEVFKGDLRNLRSRGRKGHSFRSLANHPKLTLSAATLWRAVACYELWLQMPELMDLRHFGVGHVSSVIGLPLEVQRELLSQGEAQRWTRQRLQDETAKHRSVSPRTRSHTLRVTRSLKAQLALLSDEQFLAELAEPSAQPDAELIAALRATEEACQRTLKRIAR